MDQINYQDTVYEMTEQFKSVEELESYIKTEKFINFLKETYGRKLPALTVATLPNQTLYFTFIPEKQGLPMDWRFFAGYDEITKADINKEENAEKRRLLIMEYGVEEYLSDIKILHTDAYGTLLDAEFDGVRQRFVKVRNGTKEPEVTAKYLRERKMLTEDGHKIYYIPVDENVKTAQEAVADSWAIPADFLPPKGWDYET